MPECDYCSASFDDEDTYLRHLKSKHRDELGPIDKRRVEGVRVDDDGLPTGPIALGFVVLAAVAIVGYVVFIAGGSGGSGPAGQPYDQGAVHTHGTIEMVVDGEEVDFSQPEYMGRDGAFHFHEGYYEDFGEHVYHLHARGVTVQYALGTLGIEVSDDGSELTFDGETYRDDDPDTEIEITVDGEPVEPGEYVLEGVPDEAAAADGQGDDLRVEITTDG